MTQRYFLHLAYQGTCYRGWQRQSSAKSVQATLESALSQVLKETVTVTGCGRTDAIVSARQFFAHMDIVSTWDYDILFRLNKNLPHDIVVYEIFPVHEQAHSRHDALMRTYDYYFHLNQNPFLDQVSSHDDAVDLDLEAMSDACALIKTHQDFGSLCKTPDVYSSTICEIIDVALYCNVQKNIFRFQIKANRFLRGMVRILVHEILNIGRGALITDRLWPLLLRQEEGLGEKQFAHPQGLYLSEIHYPSFARKVQDDFLSEITMVPVPNSGKVFARG
jgi:tRNA pseudouridine38-40 synthase